MSSIGIYPNYEVPISEYMLDDSVLNPSIKFVEDLMISKFPQIKILRLGGLMGGSRIFKNYYKSESGRRVNHIHYEDICAVISKMIDRKSSSKIYNLVAPLHPTKQEVANFQNGIDEKSTLLPYGREISPQYLISDLDYKFLHPDPCGF